MSKTQSARQSNKEICIHHPLDAGLRLNGFNALRSGQRSVCTCVTHSRHPRPPKEWRQKRGPGNRWSILPRTWRRRSLKVSSKSFGLLVFWPLQFLSLTYAPESRETAQICAWNRSRVDAWFLMRKDRGRSEQEVSWTKKQMDK